MRTIPYLILVSIIISFTTLSGCLDDEKDREDHDIITGSGNEITLKFGYKNFTKIEISSTFSAEIYRSDHISIVVMIDDNLRDYLEVDNSSDTFRIGLSRNASYREITNLVSITVPDFSYIKLEGASWAMLDGFTLNHSIEMDIQGASTLTSNITTENIVINVEGVSELTMQGEGSTAHIEASGVSTVDLGEFTTENTNVLAEGASTVTVNPNGILTGRVSGSSTLYYIGDPIEVNVTENDLSSVEKKE